MKFDYKFSTIIYCAHTKNQARKFKVLSKNRVLESTNRNSSWDSID